MPFRPKSTPRPGTRGEPEKTRAAILDAALHEFATETVAGARTEEIARKAGVNKALLYYYFHDKESLYGAVLDDVFEHMRARLLGVLNSDLRPRQKILDFAATHFDFVAATPEYPRVVQQETMRAGRQKSPHLKRLAQNYFQPIYARLLEVLEEGISAGEFRSVDRRRFAMAMGNVVTHYFNSLPVAQLLGNNDPLTPENIAAQRAAVLDFITHALFTTPEFVVVEAGRLRPATES